MGKDKPKPKHKNDDIGEDSDDQDDEFDSENPVPKILIDDNQHEDVKELTVFYKTGDRATREKAPKLPPKNINQEVLNSSFEESVNIDDVDHRYQPITKESKKAYSEILGLVNRLIPDQPHNFMLDCAYELISIMKNEGLSETGKKAELWKIIRLSDDSYFKLKAIIAEINDFQSKKIQQTASGNDQILNLDFSNQKHVNKIEIEFEAPNLEDDVFFNRDSSKMEVETEISDKESEIFDRATLSRILSKSGKSEEEVNQLSQKILPILGLPDDIEVQNNLFQFDEFVDSQIMNQLYQKRFEIFYGHHLDLVKTNADRFNAIIEEIKKSEVLSTRLRKLLDNYKQLGAVFGEFSKINLTNETQKSKAKIDSLTLTELSRLPKKLVSLKAKTEDLISFSSAPLKLPKNSTRIVDKGYEEITIPHKLNPLAQDEKLLKINSVPQYFREAFGDLKNFNRIQSAVFDFAFYSKKNMLLCAPTGAGKTIVALFTILGLLDSHRDPQTQLINYSNLKVVYLAPMKALVSEIVSTFNYRLNYLGVKASEFTGDIHLTMDEFEDATIIVSTPEKWDVLSRKSTERQFNEKLKLLIVDEIHLLGDNRGPVIEAVVSRSIKKHDVRVVSLSATLPNYEDVARFMDIDFNDGLFYFNNTYRPVPLSQCYIGISETGGIKRMALVKELLFKKILERIKDYQILVFVHSRKETVKTAQEIKETAFSENTEELFVTEESRKIIDGVKAKIINTDLQSQLSSGIGFHHAGLPRSDRKLVEDLFASGHLSVLISTATLAWGVNLPAHTVIIKNTQVYSPELGKWVPLSTQNLLQMLGRAGRPLYDREGEGIIITSTQEMRHYMSFLNEQQPIESSLLGSLPEILNAEVVLGNIQNLKEGCEWFLKTYLFQRLRKVPKIYGITERFDDQESQLTNFVIDAIHTAASELAGVGLIKYHREKGLLEPTPEGRIASFFYIRPENMKIYSAGLQTDLNEIDLLKLFTNSIEFKNITIREEEKIELGKLYQSVPIPIKGPIDDPKSKINVLLQCYLSRVELEGYAINCDMKFVSENAQRIFRAIFELAIHKKSASCQLVLDFCKMAERRVWKELSPLRQYAKLSDKVLQRIEQQEHLSFEHFKTMTVTQINNIVKHDQSAEYLHSMVKKFPRLETSIFVQILSRTMVRVSLSFTAEFQWSPELHGQRLMFRIFVFDVDQEKLLYHQPFFVHRYDCTKFKEEKTIEFNLAISEPLQPHYFIKIVSDEWLSCENTLPIPFKNVFLPTKFPLCREIQEEQTHQNQTSAEFLNQWSEIFGFTQFNSVQNEIFDVLYNSFNNVYFGAIRNTGKFTMALTSICRVYSETKTAKSIILFPNDDDLNRKLEVLARVANALQIEHAVLTGVLQTDIGLLTSCQLIASSARNFERLTRNYKKRPQLKQVRLVIANEISTMGDQNSAYEIALTRIRLVFSLLNQKYRLVILSSPIANFSSICDWLGIEPDFAFNYHNNLRNNDLNVLINTIDAIQSSSFLEVAAKKLVSIIKVLDTGLRACLIMVENVDAARVFSSLLLKEFLLANIGTEVNPEHRDILLQAQHSFDDVFNSSFLEFGVAYVSKGTRNEEVAALQKLFTMGILRVLVTTRDKLVNLDDIEPTNFVLVDGGKYTQVELDLSSGMLNQMNKEDQTRERRKNNLVVFLHEWEKDTFKEMLLEPCVVESQLGLNFIDVLNIEIVSGAIQKKEDCVDWLTWTYFYRRLSHNPNYYNLTSNDPLEINDFISELIDSGLVDLGEAKCIELTEDHIKSENNGIIASFYDLKVPTIMTIFNSIEENFTWRNLLHVIASSLELSDLKITYSNFKYLDELNSKVPLKAAAENTRSSYFKVFIVLQAYMIRTPLISESEAELTNTILPETLKMINGFIDCASSVLILKPALLAMKLNQLLTQRIWNNDNTLKQLPYFDDDMIDRAKTMGVEKLDDFLFMEDDDRNRLLTGLNDQEKIEIARFSNAFPNVQIEASLIEPNASIYEGDQIKLNIEITRENYEEGTPIEVFSLGLTGTKEENWWIAVVDKAQNKLFYVKKVKFEKEYKKEISVSASVAGSYNLSVLLICDWCNGFDAEISNLQVDIRESVS